MRPRLLTLPLLLALALAAFLPAKAHTARHALRHSTQKARRTVVTRAQRIAARQAKLRRLTTLQAQRIVRIALSQRGVHYRWGGGSPSTGFDCSGFTRWVYEHVGIDLPHQSGAQFSYGKPVPRSALRPGDLVFFDHLGHVGIYVGHGLFVHAPQTGQVVSTMRLSVRYGSYDGARRLPLLKRRSS
ncbi:MAG TPA: C40 family peptidase [Gaiellaceae bacterium]|nr:C40 family peptidase [Gaiellaceae bacterium]